jgi:diguanylate cyclase (GGDEF)-like protein
VKLQSKILLLIIPVIVLPLFWSGLTAYVKLKEHSIESSLGHMSTLLEQVSRGAQSHFATTYANIELFSGSNIVKKYILTEDEADRYAVMQPSLMRLFASYQRAYPDYYELRILLPDGYEDARSTLTRLPNNTEHEADSELFQKIHTSEKVFNSLYTYDPDTGKPVLYMSKKLILRDESFEPFTTPPALRGYIVISSSLRFLQEQLNQQQIGDGGYLFVIDKLGQPFLWPQNVTIDALDKMLSFDNLQKAAQSNIAIKINASEKLVYLQGRAINDELTLYTMIPEKDLLSASRGLGIVVTTVTLLTILLASVLTFYFINRILIQPIQQLGQSARDIGRGTFKRKTDITSRDEIGDLARSFEEMGRNLYESQVQITYLAYHDALTGLPNRRMFEEFLQHAVANVKRHHNGLALLFLDLDNFKQINDTMGHQAGDELLQRLSERFTACLRDEDMLSLHEVFEGQEMPRETLARVGGDEFLILLPSIDDPGEAAIVALRLQEALTKPFEIDNNEFFISSSIGISIYPTDGEDAESLIKNADIAMYHAKNNGRNNYQYFNESMNVAAYERMTLENALRKALENQEFCLHYQPKIDMLNGEIKGVEALIRWQHPKLGMVLPSKFISIAEDSGLIVAIGEWVIDEATRQIRRWQDAGIDLSMSINISTVQLNKQNVVEVIKNYIHKNGCQPDCLEIELTETSIMDAQEPAINMLNDLKALGVLISMDDFGIGYSSFRYLRNLPIDILKIDRSFVRHITANKDDAAIFSAMLAMAHTLDLRVVAEGVETFEQLEFLRNLKCDLVQGYLFSRPLPETEIREFIFKQKQTEIFDLLTN